MSTQYHSYLQLVALAISLGQSTFGVSALPQLQRRSDGTEITPTVPEPFPYESVVLTDVVAQDYPELDFDDIVYTDPESNNTVSRRTLATNLICKIIPSDNSWPTSTVWNLVNLLTGQGVIQTIPLAAPCYNGPHFNAAKCADITARWTDSDLHDQDPTSIMSPFFQGLSCMPTTNPAAQCLLGGFSNYVVKATSVSDVQIAVNLARNLNLRLVIKNTGHDFSGKSAGANSLSIWTHFFDDINYLPKYKANGYSGPAFKVGAGVQVRDIYTAAYNQHLMVVGGEGLTVGYTGGYLQGGGHSPLSSILGMGADHVLEIEVVTGDGRFVTASSSQNSDLFWAIRGGGGGTFGVVTSAIVKAYPDVPVTTVTFNFASSDTEAFWSAVKVYFQTFVTMADAGVYSYFSVFNGAFFMAPLFAPKLSAVKVKALLQPLYNKLDELNIAYTPVVTEHKSFYPAWQTNFPKELVGQTNLQTASRLFPRQNWATQQKFDQTFAAIRSVVEAQGFLLAFNMKNEFPGGGAPDNSVNPAWRQSVMHAIVGASWAENATPAEIKVVRDNLTKVQIQKWRDVTPGSGAYMSESDINEPNFQQAFYGSNYNRLYQLKQRFDPKGVFFAPTAVGSEDWSIDGSSRLCPHN